MKLTDKEINDLNSEYEVKKYRKLPVEIEAMKFCHSSEVISQLHEFTGLDPLRFIGGVNLEIPTLEGVMQASPGDFIIKGVNGEFYPCKPDIFKKTYEEVD